MISKKDNLTTWQFIAHLSTIIVISFSVALFIFLLKTKGIEKAVLFVAIMYLSEQIADALISIIKLLK